MSFIWFAATPLRTREDIAVEVHQISLARGLDSLATVIALMTIATEVGTEDNNDQMQWWCPYNDANPQSHGFPYDAKSDDGRSVGYFQQQYGPAREPWWGSTESMMTLSLAANQFFSRLADDYGTAANNPALAGQFAQRVQGSAFPDRYAANWDQAWDVFNRAVGASAPSPAPTPDPAPEEAPEPAQPQEDPTVANRPDFNEYAKPCTNFQGRGGAKVDLFLLHTQEGDGNADDLASFLISTENGPNPVSYHYTVSKGATDDGVTVCDVVDPDYASWSVMASNDRAINLCFAGSSVNWSREQWMSQSRAIDVAAFIAVRECRKYGIDPKVIPGPNYNADPPGISDHRYCGAYLHDGNNHDDVGDNFPWDYFAQRVVFWATDASAQAPAPTEAPEPAPAPEPSPVPTPALAEDPLDLFVEFLATATDRKLLEYIAAQLGPGDPSWGAKGSTLRDKVWSR